MEQASHFQYQGSRNPISFERVLLSDARASEPCASSSLDVVSASFCNPRKRDRAVFESDASARGLGLVPESIKRQRFGNYSVTEIDQVFERVVMWLAANSGERLPRTLVELEQAIQFIIGFKASVDPECIFYHLVLNDFLRLSDSSSFGSSDLGRHHLPLTSPPPCSSLRFNDNNNDSSSSSMQVTINPYPANFEGSFLIVVPNGGLPNSLSGCSRISQDFVTALNKAVTWLRSSLQLPAPTKHGFINALSKRDIVRVSYGGFIDYTATERQSSDGHHVPVLQVPAFFTAAPIC